MPGQLKRILLMYRLACRKLWDSLLDYEISSLLFRRFPEIGLSTECASPLVRGRSPVR